MRSRVYIAFLILFGGMQALAQFSPGPLSEAHKELEGLSNCTQCHSLGAKISEEKCLNCHTALNTRIKAGKGYHSSRDIKGKSCIQCHSEHHGRRFDAIHWDEQKFDHKKAGYTLRDAHAKVDCRDCHKPANIGDSKLRSNSKTFLGLEQECLSCHEDTHQGTLSEKCLDCHSMKEFESAPRFLHGKTDFPLRGKHASVSCISCHAVKDRNGKRFQQFAGVAHTACTDCHTDPHQGRFGRNCTSCHNERSWTQLNSGVQFDHSKTRYPLEGMHAYVDCKSCHKGGYSKKLAFGRCLDCHKDYHEGDFKGEDGKRTDCAECHSVQATFEWSSYGLDQHQQSRYPLENAHLATSCIQCHKPSGESRWSFRFESTGCVSCHENPHTDYLDQRFMPDEDCKTCHVTERWNKVAFDHDQTDFPLEGPHAEANCRSCHFSDERDAASHPVQQFADLHSDCVSCHEDPHGGQFDRGEDLADCSSCHAVEVDWPASRFDHGKTQFPLDGRHAEISCVSCHKTSDDTGEINVTLYKIKDYQCIDCHN